MESASFHLFSTFPLEIRRQIWKECLPEPRIIDLELMNSKHQRLNNRIVRCGGPWFWATKSKTFLPTLQVSKEAREFTLESYKPTNIRTGHGLHPTSTIYVDFKRDTLYRYRYQYDPLFQIHRPYQILMDNASSWMSHTTQLALPFFTLHAFRYFESHEEDLNYLQWPEYRVPALRILLLVCMHFPALKTLLLVLDGRDDQIEGKTDIVDASTLPYNKHYFGRDAAVKLAEQQLVEDLQRKRPDVIVPQIKVAIFKNREEIDTASLENRWCQLKRWGKRESAPSICEPICTHSRWFRCPCTIDGGNESSSESSGSEWEK